MGEVATIPKVNLRSIFGCAQPLQLCDLRTPVRQRDATHVAQVIGQSLCGQWVSVDLYENETAPATNRLACGAMRLWHFWACGIRHHRAIVSSCSGLYGWVITKQSYLSIYYKVVY